MTSVLMGVPGESASVVTAIDGFQLAKRGRAGVALGIAAIGSFIGGTLSVIGLMLVESPDVVWGLIASMYIGNILLVIINVACIPAVVALMDKIKGYLPVVILLLSVFGVYSYRNSVADILIMLIFALVGYSMQKLDFPRAPLILGLLLGGMAETSLRQALAISNGSLSIFTGSPITVGFLCLAVISIIVGRVAMGGKRKPKAPPAQA